MGSKKHSTFFGTLALVLFLVSGTAFYTAQHQAAVHDARALTEGRGRTSPSLIVEPQAGTVPLENMIKSASTSIELVMYEFEDKNIEQLLAKRAREGIAVRVILDNGYFGAGSGQNEQAFDYLRQNGVSVHWSPEYFALTHQKTLVIDDEEVLIMTFNLTPQYYKGDRDFGVLDDDVNDVTAVEDAFSSDWNGSDTLALNADDLVWSPNSRGQLLALINGAQKSLDVYNEEMADPEITAALATVAARGIDVRIDMSYSNNWKSAFQTLSDAGAHVRTYAASAPLYIHAKVIIQDGVRAFVGSENFSPTSLEQNRELGLILSDTSVVSALSKTFAADWQNAAPFTP